MVRHIFTLVVSGAFLSACVSTKQPKPMTECKAAVEQWANNEPVQGIPQGDGGVVFIKPRLNGAHDLFILVSKKNEGKVMQDIKLNKINEVSVGECRHPVNGYPYTTLEFTVAPDLKEARG